MSTFDTQGQAHEPAKRSSPWSALGAALGGALLMVAGACGAGVAMLFFDTFRLMSLDSVFGNWDSRWPVEWMALAVPVAGIGTAAASVLYGASGRRGGAALWIVGFAVGGWLLGGQWTPPDVVGTAFDPTFGDHEPWGPIEWVWYSLPWALPTAGTIVALFSLLALTGDRRRS